MRANSYTASSPPFRHLHPLPRAIAGYSLPDPDLLPPEPKGPILDETGIPKKLQRIMRSAEKAKQLDSTHLLEVTPIVFAVLKYTGIRGWRPAFQRADGRSRLMGRLEKRRQTISPS